jgi:hypothetical protein
MSQPKKHLFDSNDPNEIGPVTCLGMTFPNDLERRRFFNDKLTLLLNEHNSRTIEGFPHADNADILAMSNPPYFTACPNPFLNQFLELSASHGDDQVEYRREPFTADVSEGKTDPLYTAHAYHTKVPHKAIMRYILHYTQPGDLVLDGFCGTGMTGVAAQLCADKREVEALGYIVSSTGEVSKATGDEKADRVFSRIGARKAILNDLSPAAAFIAANYATPVDADLFALEASRILKEVEEELGWMYETLHEDGKTKGRINYTLWSDLILCSDCGKEIVFVDEALNTTTGEVAATFPCPHCGADTDKNKCELVYESNFDELLGRANSMPKRVPVMIQYVAKGTKYEKKPDIQDLALLKRISTLSLPPTVPHNELPDMQMRRVGRMKPTRITHIHHFFLPRAAHSVATLWTKASTVDNLSIRNALLFFVEQAIAGHSLLNRYKPVMHGTYGGSQVNNGLSGVFYIASQIAECSPRYNLEGKLKRLTKVFEQYQPQAGNTYVTVQDLSAITLPENSIDYIFTDPPFGENIYYSDLNILIESWHRVLTDPRQEVIVDRVKGKTLLDYQRMMSECFERYYQALKPGRWMTVEFHNSKNSVWNAIQEALQHAGFVVADVRTLDKKQGSFQQVVSGNTVKRDLIISAYKPNGGLEEKIRTHAGSDQGAWEFTTTHLRQLPVFVSKAGKAEQISERQGYLLYDRMVAFHVQRGYPVPLSSPEFHAGLRQRFAERDGMYFLPDQVAEYDRKRMEVNAVEQLELFVSDEKSAIQWVRQQLAKQPMTYKELQPIYMREAQRVWDKHEQPLELRTILEQNFIQDNDDTWRAADSKKEADLEQQRRRQLLKEFQEYLSSKGKLKIVRMEALRAGFTEAWQKKDYATIVQIAKRVPEAVIQEDQSLLMYFDNASLLLGE